MKHDIDTMLEELYELDPSLRSRGDLRVVVKALLASRPDARPDPTFIARLRHDLTSRPSSSARPQIIHSPYWWMFRLAPVGVLAVLLLAFVGQTNRSGFDFEAPSDSTDSSPTYLRVESIPPMGAGGEAPTSFKATGMSAESAPAPSMDSAVTQTTGAISLNVSEQLPGLVVSVDYVELGARGFVVIREGSRDGFGLVLGTSSVLPIGRIEGITILLARPMREDEVFAAVLYADDGDGVYRDGIDEPILDPVLGIPMYAVFGATSATTGGVSI